MLYWPIQMKPNKQIKNTPWEKEIEKDLMLLILTINIKCNTTRFIYFEENYEKL